MGDIFILVEHRQGKVRDITYELLTLGRELAEKNNLKLKAILLTEDSKKYLARIKKNAHSVLCVDNKCLKNFNTDIYQKIITNIIKQKNPLLTLIGHTAFGVDLAPALAQALDLPLVTDCLGLTYKENTLFAERQMYGGKVHTRIAFKKAESYLATVQQGAIPVKHGELTGDVEKVESPALDSITYRKFIEYIEAAAGDVDITQADIIVSVGRGIKEKENLTLVNELAETIGGVVACSRPIVDAGWLAKDRQVGSSGKTVTPKLYIALGISGSSQHMMGMKGASTIVAINKDPNAPIFTVADYGIVDDLFKVVPVLKQKYSELKKG